MLRYPDRADLQVFSASYFEDLVFGAREQINIMQFMQNTLGEFERMENGNSQRTALSLQKNENQPSDPFDTPDAKRILEMVNRSPQVKRGLVWMILDWSFFTEKVKIIIKRLFGK